MPPNQPSKRFIGLFAVIIAVTIAQLWALFTLAFFTPSCTDLLTHALTGAALQENIGPCPANPFNEP